MSVQLLFLLLCGVVIMLMVAGVIILGPGVDAWEQLGKKK